MVSSGAGVRTPTLRFLANNAMTILDQTLMLKDSPDHYLKYCSKKVEFIKKIPTLWV